MSGPVPHYTALGAAGDVTGFRYHDLCRAMDALGIVPAMRIDQVLYFRWRDVQRAVEYLKEQPEDA